MLDGVMLLWFVLAACVALRDNPVHRLQNWRLRRYWAGTPMPLAKPPSK
jgi:hypothetical protein